MIIFAPLLLPAIQGYLWVQRGETWKAVLLGLGMAAAIGVAGWVWWRIQKARQGARFRDPLQIREKVSRLAYEAQVEITAILPDGGTEDRAKELLRNAAAAYGNYNNLAGASFKATKIKPVLPATDPWPPSRGVFQARNVLCSRELAALWHPLGGGDDLPMVGRAGARTLMPSPRSVAQGAPVGDTVGANSQEVRFSEDLLRRHHFYLARTRMGKSTLMQTSSPTSSGRRTPVERVTPSSSWIPTPTWWSHCWATCRRISPARCGSSTWPTTAGPRASTCWTPGCSPTGTAPPSRWCASPTACGTSGVPGCSPSWSTRSRSSTSTTPTRTPGRMGSSPSWTVCECCRT